jgi:integrase/recombinase XerD
MISKHSRAMLTMYRCHEKRCIHKAEGRKYDQCRCPWWIDGTIDGRRYNRSLRTRNREQALNFMRELEVADKDKTEDQPEAAPITVKEAWDKLLADLPERGLKPATIRKHNLLATQTIEFARSRGLTYLTEFTVDNLREFRASWKDGIRSSTKKLERLRQFFRFAEDSGWIKTNPASKLKSSKIYPPPTLPFSDDEMTRIMTALDKYRELAPPSGQENAARLRALVLLARYTGLRIGDLVGLSTDKTSGNRLFLRTQKTGTAVCTVLPESVLRELGSIPRASDTCFFWSGKGKLDSTVRSWQARFRRLFALAEIPDGHAHRFRDTFATELLLAGVPMERVSVHLGHRSVKITEQYYSPWVASRQRQLEADLERVWSRDKPELRVVSE